MLNIYSVEETCSDGLGVTHRPTFKIMTLLKSSKPELRDRGALMTRCLQTWKVDLKFGRSSKSLFIETPTRRHQTAVFVFSQRKSKVYVQRPKGKGLKPDNFHGPTRICLVFVEVFSSRCSEDYQSRGARDVATRALRDGWKWWNEDSPRRYRI